MKPTENAGRKSTAKSLLAVLVLGLAIFGIIRGAVWLWGGEDTDTLPPIWMSWAERWYYRPWTDYGWLSVILILVLAAVTLFAIVRGLGRNTPQAERRAVDQTYGTVGQLHFDA